MDYSDTYRHDRYYSDAYRTIANIVMDYSWFATDEWQVDEAKKIQKYFCETLGGNDWDRIYLVDGTVLEENALHPVAIIATNAESALITDTECGKECVRKFWETPLREGNRRYYDNCLYFLAFLALSGNYRIY